MDYFLVSLAFILMIAGVFLLRSRDYNKINHKVDSLKRAYEQKQGLEPNFYISFTPTFYQYDDFDLTQLYETINNDELVDQKINSNVEISGGIDIAPLKLELKNSTFTERKNNPLSNQEKYIICLIYFIKERKLVQDLQHLSFKGNELDKFDEFLDTAEVYGFELSNEKVNLKRSELRNSIIQEIIDEKNQYENPCLIRNYEFRVLKKDDEYELETTHPLNEYLPEDKKILITVLISKSTITPNGKRFFMRNVDKSTKFTVFGKVNRVTDEKNNIIELQVTPYAIA